MSSSRSLSNIISSEIPSDENSSMQMAPRPVVPSSTSRRQHAAAPLSEVATLPEAVHADHTAGEHPPLLL